MRVAESDCARTADHAPGRRDRSRRIGNPVVSRTAVELRGGRQRDRLIDSREDHGRLVAGGVDAHVGIDPKIQIGGIGLVEHRHDVGVDRSRPSGVARNRRNAAPVADVSIQRYGRRPDEARHQNQQQAGQQ